MFKLLKFIIYALIIGAVALYIWALPKLNFIKNNPGFCTELSRNLYYCGSKADVESMFKLHK